MSWNDLRNQAAPDPDEVKRQLDLVAVCGELGISLDDAGGGRWTGLCPFHDDHDPSFSVWFDHDRQSQRCGCWSCDFGHGDVFDLLRAWYGCDFPTALQIAQELVERNLPEPERPEQPDPPDLAVQARQAAAREDDAVLDTFLTEKGLTVDARWLRRSFHVGVTVDGGGVVIPHYGVDGSCTALKVRRPSDWTPKATRGSKLHVLYGEWRDTGQPRLVLCEGETDVWSLSWRLRDDPSVLVLGLPSGAGAKPRNEWMDLTRGREVTLLFDADQAGRRAAREWVGHVASFARNVYVAALPDGQDVSSSTTAETDAALRHARQLSDQPPPALNTRPEGYRRNNTQGTPVSDFTLRLHRVIHVEGELTTFEVQLPDNRVVELPDVDLNSDQRTASWANRHQYVWYGNRKDAQELMRMLLLEAPFVPQLRGTRVAGYHDGRFVLPKPVGCVGPGGWAYVPPVADPHLERRIDLESGEWERHVPTVLATLHRSDVVRPILGWVAAAPLRDLVRAFPILAVVGGSGWGKTTLLQEILRTFGFVREPQSLTATTPHGVHSMVAATNSIPVWFDEYRAGIRQDTKVTFEQVIRDAWNATSSVKGGLREQRQELVELPCRAPIVVSGEDAFSETSHVERMVLVDIPRDGRDSDALGTLREAQRYGFGRSYLEWLVDLIHRDELPSPPDVDKRPDHARAVSRWGWELYRRFAREATSRDVGEFDETRISSAHDSEGETPPIVELLDEHVGTLDRQGRGVVWADGDDLCVRVLEFVKQARESDLTLPGGSRAVRKWLTETFEVTEERGSWGRYLRLHDAAWVTRT